MKRSELIANLFDIMDTAKRSMHNHMQTLTSGYAISRTQIELLFTIFHTQPVTSTELAKKLHLTPGAISQLTEELDKQQLIERRTDPADRRRHVLTISDKGNELVKTFGKRRRAIMEHVMQDLTDEELAAWLKIQQKIIAEFQSTHTEIKEERK